MNDDATLDEFADSEEFEETDTGKTTQETEKKPVREMFGIGQIPREWSIQSLANSAKIIAGNSPPSSTYTEEKTGLPFFQGNAEFEHFHPEPDTWCSEPRKVAEPNDILISIRAPVGDLNIADQRCCIGRGLASIRPDDTNRLYLYYHLTERKNWLSRLATGSTFNSVTKGDLQNLDIPLPPLSEQRKIATVLHTVDQAIQKTEEIIEQLEQLRDGLTQDVLTTGYHDHTEYRNVRLGPIRTSVPKNWDINTIPDCFEIIDGDRGKNYPSGSELQENEYCLFLSATNVTDQGLKFDETEFITEQKDSELRKGKVKRGDIIMTTRGTVGNFGYYDEWVNYENMRINSGMVILRPKERISSVKFYYHFFRSQVFQRQINATSYGTAQPQTSVTDIKKMDILEPSEREKEQIAELFDKVNSNIQSKKQYRDRLVSLKHGLMQDLLSGKVRTTDVDIDIPEEVAKYG